MDKKDLVHKYKDSCHIRIEAIQYGGTNTEQIIEWIRDKPKGGFLDQLFQNNTRLSFTDIVPLNSYIAYFERDKVYCYKKKQFEKRFKKIESEK